MHEEFNDNGPNIVGIAHASLEFEVRTMVDELGLTFPNIYDLHGRLPAAYDASTGVPSYFFLDKELRIAHEIRGAPGDVNVIKEKLIELQREDVSPTNN